MANLRRNGLIWVLVFVGIGSLWGTRNAVRGSAWIDFRGLYCGTRCLIHHHNPYNQGDVEREYLSEDGQRPLDTPVNAFPHLQSLTLWVNLPSTFVVAAPFAVLSWGPAHILWMLLTGCAFILAVLLMWHAGMSHSPRVATFLACIAGLNCEPLFGGGNAAGIVVGFCAIAVWCFLRNRFVWIGVLCLALSLAVKPHDSGFVWLYFLLAGGAFRKRALQSAVIVAVIGLASVLWVSHVAPNWLHEWNANLATSSVRGGINEPGPSAVKDGSVYSIVDLQGAISVFRDDPHFYNTVSYVLCGALLLVWAVCTLRTRFSVPGAWLALGAAVPLTLLINYHRLWDAELAMLAIPACCLLWAEGGSLGKAAMPITSAAVLAAGKISLVTFEAIVGSFPFAVHGILTKAITVVLIRPASFALLAMGVFYLWVYLRRIPAQQPGAVDAVSRAEPALELR
jgi:hypothetical protein